MGGANFRHLYSIQGAGQIQTFLRHWRAPTTQAGKLLRISVAWFQLETGISRPVFADVDTPVEYSGSKWLLSIRTFLQHVGGSFTLTPTFVPSRRRLHDKFIMDEIIDSNQFSARDIRLINLCRLYLQATFLSDLTNATGTHLDQHLL